jgi:hypothetical protein
MISVLTVAGAFLAWAASKKPADTSVGDVRFGT